MRVCVCFLGLAIAAAAPAVASRAVESTSTPGRVAEAGEATWKTVLLAPGRIVGHGRFDAARPSYHARRAEKQAAVAAAQAGGCAPCVCEKR